jgi:site-specific DNA-methyltransferase (adenine-specific)
MNIILGDCLEKLKLMADNSVDAIVTDPPAGIGFMNKEWDSNKGGRDQWMKWLEEIMTEALRVLKAGGHCLVWALPRTSHWTAMACENAGFEIRDCVYHIQSQGFPKSLNISKAIDKKFGAERQVVGKLKNQLSLEGKKGDKSFYDSAWGENKRINLNITAPSTDKAKEYDGYGTQLKPAVECWWLLRKPIEGKNIVDNVLKYGTGGINIDKSRIPTEDKLSMGAYGTGDKNGFDIYANKDGRKKTAINRLKPEDYKAPQGRFPANLMTDGSDAVMQEFAKYGESKSSKAEWNSSFGGNTYFSNKHKSTTGGYDDSGSVARFFYCSKASTSERNLGLETLDNMEIILYLCKKELWKEKLIIQEEDEAKQLMGMETLLQKAIAESGIVMKNDSDLSITLYMKILLERFLLDTKSTTKMKINSTTIQQILSWLQHYTINESTLDAYSKMMDGGNLVVNVENSNTLIITISEKVGYHLGVNPVALKMLVKINERKINSTHPTVKSVKLMSYLVNLIAPPITDTYKPVILDCFMGTGTTGIAALLNGYDFIGIELSEDYMKIAQARINNSEEFRKYLK